MKKKKPVIIFVLWLLLIAAGCSLENDTGYTKNLTLATTTSTYDTGLLDTVLPDFERAHNIGVEVISVGTGQALELGRSGDCDIILVHARELEDEFVSEGYGAERRDVMYNDYVYLGPGGDPGHVKNARSLREALELMTEHMESEEAVFLSRGDNSGTHAKEISLWQKAEVDNFEEEQWYLSMGQGMGDVLIAANEMKGYVISDRGTYLAMKDKLPNLEIVFEGDESMINPYGIIPVNPDKHSHVKYDKAMLLVDFFLSEETQGKIGDFGTAKYGQPLFFPDAG